VAQAVVDVLEPVEVEQEQRGGDARLAGRVHPVGEGLAVGDARQVVDLRLAPKAPLGLDPRGDVADDRAEAVLAALRPVG
jgi:hypothetical protein